MKIGFVGLGAMGSGIASNIANAGYDLTVFDVDQSRVDSLVNIGAQGASSIATVARDADVLFTSLPTPSVVMAVGTGPDGLEAHLKPGAAWFDLSTNSPTVIRQLAERLKNKNVDVLDAPVSGRPQGAASGKLAIYIGGPVDIYEKYKTLLDSIGDKIIHVGAVGAGNTTKLVHNLISLVSRMVLAEGMSLGVKAGMEPLVLWGALRQGAIGRQRTFDVLADHYMQDKYDPAGFALTLAHKDFTLALDLAQELGISLQQASEAYKFYNEALARDWGNRDSRAPMSIPNERAGIVIKEDPEKIRQVLMQ